MGEIGVHDRVQLGPRRIAPRIAEPPAPDGREGTLAEIARFSGEVRVGVGVLAVEHQQRVEVVVVEVIAAVFHVMRRQRVYTAAEQDVAGLVGGEDRPEQHRID